MIKLINGIYSNIFQSLVFKTDFKSIENLFMQDPLDKRAEIGKSGNSGIEFGKLGNHVNPTRIPRVVESRIPRKINMQFDKKKNSNRPVILLTNYSFNLFDLVFQKNQDRVIIFLAHQMRRVQKKCFLILTKYLLSKTSY